MSTSKTPNEAMIAALQRERAGLAGRDGNERRVDEIDEQLKRYGYVKTRGRGGKDDSTPADRTQPPKTEA